MEQGAAPRQLPPGCQALIVLALARLSPAKKYSISLDFWEKKQCSGILESAQAFKCFREGKEELLGEGSGSPKAAVGWCRRGWDGSVPGPFPCTFLLNKP